MEKKSMVKVKVFFVCQTYLEIADTSSDDSHQSCKVRMGRSGDVDRLFWVLAILFCAPQKCRMA